MVLDRHRLCVSSETNPRITEDNKSQAKSPVLAARAVSPWTWKCVKFKTSKSQMSSNRERPRKVAHKALGMISRDLALVSTTLKLDP